MSAPRLRGYIEALPAGLASYEACTVKASVTRLFYEGFGSPSLDHTVPSAIKQLVEDPPPVSVFVSQVLSHATFLAMGDALGYSDEQMVARARELNASLMLGPMYRVLFAFVSPERLLRHVPTRWEAFHRGTSVTIDAVGPTSCKASMLMPAHCSNELLSSMHLTALEVALEAAGAKSVEARLEQATPMVARFSATWRR